MIDRARRFAGGGQAVAAAFALHLLTLAWFAWRTRGEVERLYWEYGGRVLGRAYTDGYTDWVQHRTGTFPPIEAATLHAAYAAPYSGFACEYPPGALWLFALIRALAEDVARFSMLAHLAMALCCAGTSWIAWRTLARRQPGRAQALAALALVALWPMLTGPMAVQRFDPLAALLAAAALALAARGRSELAGAAAGLGAAVKIWPGLIVPFLVIAAWRAGRWRAGFLAGATALAAFALPHLGTALLGTRAGDLLGYLAYLRDRPPEVESLTANLIALVARVTGADIAASFDFGSFNLQYEGAGAWTSAASLANAAALLALLGLVWRARGDDRAGGRLVCAAGALVCATIACSRVFSSEYLIWLLPFALLAAGTRGGIGAIACYAAALLSLKLFYRFPEWPMGLSTRVIALSLARNLLVLGMAGCFVAELVRRGVPLLNSPGRGAMSGPAQAQDQPSP